MISIENTSIGFNTHLFSADGICFDKGKVHALMGKNGIGKSAFLRTLSGLIHPLKGSIQIDGKEIMHYKGAELAKKISFVNSVQQGVPYLTVDAFLLLARTNYTTMFGKYSDEDHTCVQEAKSKFNISHLSGKYTDELSSGELQLCAIAKAYVQGADFILLDEPTSHLDYSNKRKVYELLVEIATKEDKGVIISTHDIDLAFKFPFEYCLLDSNTKEMRGINSMNEIEIEFSS